MQVPQYILTGLGVSTNGMQLKMNSQRLLREQYEKKLSQSNAQFNLGRRSSFYQKDKIMGQNAKQSNQIAQTKNRVSDRSYSVPRLRQSYNQQIIKNSLQQQLNQQIAFNERVRREQKVQDIVLEKKLVQGNGFLFNKQMSKQKAFQQTFKQEALFSIRMKQLRKQSQRMQEDSQKKLIDRQYRQNQQLVQRRISGLQNDNVSAYPLGMGFGKMSQSLLFSTQMNPQVGIFPRVSVHRPSNQQQKALRNNLRDTLVEQMRMKAQQKTKQKQQRLTLKFVDPMYRFLNDPIINPIDVKIAKDNPYVIRELLGKGKVTMGRSQSTSGNNRELRLNSLYGKESDKMSYLSRKGSSSLLKQDDY